MARARDRHYVEKMCVCFVYALMNLTVVASS